VTAVLDVRDLRTEFRMRDSALVAVDGVSFSIDEAECVGMVGESGCGKSTVGLSIMRLLPKNGHVIGGSVHLLGRDLASLSERTMETVRGNEVALIPQDPMTSLNPTMAIGRQIAEGVRLHRKASKAEARQRALEVLRLVDMPRPEERLGQYPHELSGGLRQRVMIAMALTCEPKLLIADEPTTALDVTIQSQVLDIIGELRLKLRMAVLLITHDMGVIAGRTDRVVVMYAGKVAEEATTDNLFNDMRHPYTEALLVSVPRLDQDVTVRLRSIPGIPPDLSEPIEHCRFAARCPFAESDCWEQDPALVAVDGQPGHRFACFHPVSGRSRTPVAVAHKPAPGGEEDSSAKAVELVQVESLVKEFPVLAGAVFRHSVGHVHAVSDISFAIRKGEVFGLVGESGCGKTTVGRLLVALESPNSGSIRFEGQELTTLKTQELRGKRQDFQMMFQDPYASLDPRMRVGPIIREPLKVQGVGTSTEQRQRVLGLLNEVGLSPQAAERYPHEFSGGQRQRIGLARALALEPKLIVADEPVSALDVSIQAQILNLMKDLQSQHSLSFLFISHDLAVVRYMADTIAVMYLGKIVEMGPAREVYERAAHPYTQGLLDAVPAPDVPSNLKKIIDVRGELPSAVDPPSGCRFRTRCPRAQEVCAQVEPVLTPYGAGHIAACHFPLQTPVDLVASTPAAN
jgi:oligopeptide/dipeptide ABC transporter ATP-binding protein